MSVREREKERERQKYVCVCASASHLSGAQCQSSARQSPLLKSRCVSDLSRSNDVSEPRLKRAHGTSSFVKCAYHRISFEIIEEGQQQQQQTKNSNNNTITNTTIIITTDDDLPVSAARATKTPAWHRRD